MLRVTFLAATALTAGLLVPPQTSAAGFDCGKATTATEKTICADKTLDQMDTLLSVMYRRAYQSTDDKAELKKTQLKWLKSRNSACSSSSNNGLCEQSYLNAYKRLKEDYYKTTEAQNSSHSGKNTPAVAALLSGMSMPNGDDLSILSANAVNSDPASYKPWPRKELAHFEEGYPQIMGVAAGVHDNVIYLYVALKKSEQYEVYEINSSTGVQRRLNVSQDWNYQTSLLDVKQGYLFITRDGGEARPSGPTQNLLIYPVGSGETPRLITEKEYATYRSLLGPKHTYAVSDSGRWMAAYGWYIHKENYKGNDAFGNLNTMRDYSQSNLEIFAEASTFYIYDRENKQGYNPEIGIRPEDWGIESFTLHPTKPIIYFDNSGARACIWEYHIKTHELYKIVPEHKAHYPYIVTLDGQDFMAFAMENKDYSQISIYLAAKP
ncbi:Protein of unknown function [Vibrio xiamenensis]|uniref:Lysozyme inhibitor LprI-like N-terminal domain-containing protein n=1 Tax=Vibrio xiamenensis TaxID=861298 RepID=A0A1G8GJZ6_9VIBR|nr:lysozyme inhibitor LprI family protein [Vibrio xiamenensis]SDH94724.1 Protein of unknown function [Vibrio xiamenensis]